LRKFIKRRYGHVDVSPFFKIENFERLIKNISEKNRDKPNSWSLGNRNDYAELSFFPEFLNWYLGQVNQAFKNIGILKISQISIEVVPNQRAHDEGKLNHGDAGDIWSTISPIGDGTEIGIRRGNRKTNKPLRDQNIRAPYVHAVLFAGNHGAKIIEQNTGKPYTKGESDGSTTQRANNRKGPRIFIRIGFEFTEVF